MEEKKILDLACQAIVEIVEQKITFSKAIKSVFEHDEPVPETKSNVSAFVGCVLRHYYVFDQFVKDNFKELKTSTASKIYVVLANNLFLKRFSETLCNEYVNEGLLAAGVAYDKEKFDELLLKIGKDVPLIPESIDKGSFEFLSLRFNAPLWLIKMWSKHFGRGLTYKILKANSRPSLTTVRVNTLSSSKEQLLEKYHNLLEPSEIEDILIYKSRSSIRKENFYREFRVFYEKMALKYLFDLLEFDPLKTIAIYSHDFNPAFLELATRTKNEAKFDIIVPSGKDVFQYKTAIANFKLSNRIKAYECAITGLVSTMSAPVSTFVVFPQSSNFELLRSEPDYFFRFNPETLDQIIETQNLTLEECAKFVENGGRLVYAIPTISKKESVNVVSSFLRLHPEFQLAAERQIFPFETLDSSLYYAIIIKEDKKID